ncbi:MAG: DUF2723 domain-containing protein, partial [Candidatus Goldbacteria bacterium]|nr:DUF2723 domain-containing protein [Candidatus Goldiibacteriota bacterium]
MKNLKSLILILTFFLVNIILFLKKLPFTFIADDSPETVTCFVKLLIQHPPGYPLDTLLGKIFTLIPFGNPMVKANFLSCFFHILSALILFFIVLKILKNEKEKFLSYLIAAVASIFFLFSNTSFWQAMSAKGSIYTLHSFFTAVIFYSLLNIKK